MRLTFFHLLVLLVLGIVRGHDGDDDHGSSHLWLEEPQALAAKYEEAFMDHAEALFGIPSYGEEITARLIYATPGANAEGCDVYPDATTETWRSQANDEEFILLIDRGTCNFVKKVRNAEEAGASAVLIADSQCLNGDPYGYCDDYGKPTGGTSTSTPGTCANGNAAHALGCTGAESALPFMANDGSGDNIRIPSYLVSAYNAQNLKSALCSKSDKSSCSVAADYTSFVMVTMEWDVPSTDGHVDWEIWTSSEDWYGAEFKREFARVARELEESTDFTPHYYHYDGLESGCMDATSGENVCVSNCINSGRYCSITPHGENIDSVTGADVVKENLRQMCVWKVSKAASKEYQWWDYIVDYADQCFGEEGVENSESLEQCSTQVMQENGITYADVQSCITGSGGYDVNGGANTMLQADLEMKKQLMILELPTIIVNGATLRLSPSYGPVLTAICAAYTDGTEPLICDKVLDPSGNNDGKWILQANVLIEFQTSSFTVDEFNWQLQSEFRSQMAFKAGVDKAAVSLDRITQYNANSIKAHVYFHELTDDELDTAKISLTTANEHNDIRFYTANSQSQQTTSVLVIVTLDGDDPFYVHLENIEKNKYVDKGEAGTTDGVIVMLVLLTLCMIVLTFAVVALWRRAGMQARDLNIFADMIAMPRRFKSKAANEVDPTGRYQRPLGDYAAMNEDDDDDEQPDRDGVISVSVGGGAGGVAL